MASPRAQVIPALRHPEQKMADDAWHIATIAPSLGLRRAGRLGADLGRGAAPARAACPAMPFRRSPISSNPASRRPQSPSPCPPGSRTSPNGAGARIGAPQRPGFDIDDLAEAAPETWLIFTDDSGPLHRRRRAPDRGGPPRDRRSAPATPSRATATATPWPPNAGREGYDLLIRDLAARGIDPHPHPAWLAGHARAGLPPRLQLSAPQSGTGVLVAGLPDPGAGRGRSAPPDPHHHPDHRRGAGEGREPLASPEKAMILGPLRVVAARKCRA